MLTVSWALSPLGFGTTNSRAPSNELALLAHRRLGKPERCAVGGDPGDRHHDGVVPAHEPAELLATGAQFLAVQLGCLCGRPVHDVGDTDAPLDHVAAVGVGHAGPPVDRPLDDARLQQRRIEAVSRVGEVGLCGCRPEPGVDPDEQQTQAGPDQVGNDRVAERLEFCPRKPHVDDARRLRHCTDGERSLAAVRSRGPHPAADVALPRRHAGAQGARRCQAGCPRPSSDAVLDSLDRSPVTGNGTGGDAVLRPDACRGETVGVEPPIRRDRGRFGDRGVRPRVLRLRGAPPVHHRILARTRVPRERLRHRDATGGAHARLRRPRRRVRPHRDVARQCAVARGHPITRLRADRSLPTASTRRARPAAGVPHAAHTLGDASGATTSRCRGSTQPDAFSTCDGAALGRSGGPTRLILSAGGRTGSGVRPRSDPGASRAS